MNFKKKAIIGIAAGLFAVATVFNMNMLNEKNSSDVSLDAIAEMAEAQTERDSTNIGHWTYISRLGKWDCIGSGSGC